MAQRKSYNGLWIAVSIALVCVPVFLYLYFSGWVYGEEFSPDDFSRRRFSYNSMPFFKITVKGIEYDDMTPVFEQTLFADGLIGKANPVKRWHLISDSISVQDSPDFDAKLLARILDLKNENNDSIWIAWNENYPHLAKRFWPIIADLARENLYLDVADIMQNAIGLDKANVDKFSVALEEMSSEAFCRKGRNLLNDKENKKAIDCFSKSIDILATKQALEGRAEAYKTIGENDKSAADLDAAKKLDDQ